jgi:hypothetical protein
MRTKDEVTESIRGYLSYRLAVRQYENHESVPSAGIANYEPMPGPRGASLLFFEQQGKMADMGRTSFNDLLDYRKYKRIVDALESAFETLTEDELSVVKLKWIHDVTLKQIADRKDCSIDTIKKAHGRGLSKMLVGLRFETVPEIIRFDTVSTF